MRIVLVTGGFDPIHSGHIALINAARTLGDLLIVGVNSDAWLVRKKGRAFMPIAERKAVIAALQGVHDTLEFNDDDDSAKELLIKIKKEYPYAKIIFANGGDRTSTNIPEMTVEDVEFVFGVGGEDKKNSSSWILEEWKAPKTQRPWGYYRVLHESPGLKVKELVVNPGQNLSMQRHLHRNEYWIVEQGQCVVSGMMDNGYLLPNKILERHGEIKILANEWHQLQNPYKDLCRVVEIQYGDHCIEEDIERK